MTAKKAKAPTGATVEAFSETTHTNEGFEMNSITTSTVSAITPFNFHGSDVRIIMRNGAPWFVAADLAEVLGYRDAANAGRVLDDDEKGTHAVSTLGGKQNLTIVSESGMYALVLRSRKPEARKFAKWVTAEVLPAIRKTGGYGQPEQLTLNQRLDRYAQQIEEGNGLPLVMFMPLWAAINRRMMESIAPSTFQIGGYRQELAHRSH
jgi:prophage antirepressor-like protein